MRIPFSPTFLTQVNAGNVKEVTSKNNAIQGTFKNDVKYPESDKKAPADDAVLDTGAVVRQRHGA